MTNTLIGKTLGNCEIRDLIGRGGMATVYLGYQKNVDRQVAVKVLPPHPGLDEEFKERFQLEAKTIARLQHPHILPLYDYGAQDDLLYLVMAYIAGGTLESRIATGEMTLEEMGRILREIGGALDYAHRQGIVHRDIKPANILLDNEGHALLTDFGIAKLTEGNVGLTGTNVVGTPAYMSPEQAQGMDITGAADVYSLGVVVFQALTGKLPFNAPSVLQLMLSVVQDPVPDLSDFVEDAPQGLNAVLSRVLAKDPEARYQTATEFAEAFSEAIDDTRKMARPLKRLTEDEAYTIKQTALPVHTRLQADPPTSPQTVIVQQATNPFVLLIGFALIAITLVAIVLIIVGNNNQLEISTTRTDTPSPTRPVVVRPAVQTFGRLSYSRTGDVASLRVERLLSGGADNIHIAWLYNTATGDLLRLGDLSLDALGSGGIQFTDPEGRVLPTLYNALLISRETSSDVDTPSDDVRYSARLPEGVLQVVYELLVSSPNGINNGSLLRGIRLEATIAAQHAGLAAGSRNATEMHIHAEHTINALTGGFEDYNGDGTPENPGRQVGVYQLADIIEMLIDDVLDDEYTTRFLQTNAEFIRVCLQNTRQRADQVIEFEFELLASDSIEAVSQQAADSARIARELIDGVDLNQNGDIEPFEGECGLEQIEFYALLLGTLDVVEGGLD